jgi:hypothetical protein
MRLCSNEHSEVKPEIFMYIGIGTILVIALIIFLVL